MSSTLIERVARAIVKSHRARVYGLYDYSSYPGEKPPHVVRDERTGKAVFRSENRDVAHNHYEELCRQFVARAAIEAMREPTWEMLYFGEGLETLAPPREALKIRWRAMIDAALSSGQDEKP